ncbi:hypothetical protein F5B22DRAFT_214424 [Xylaria bambusicola]|uniref:uncharacterized protein n=1 Tax=Xylaria bambusicola TaxID=326684 RepID=UPI00200782F3|nr:uncharacterized protein F5B22DRAFT_214424 [Xylaria bambusicola]KAI0514750.1 hypothetical protein F5B22DRAFT_214424 [Xylaria bambusicola]
MGVPKFDTPRRAKIRGTVEFFEAHGDLVDKKITKRDIFRYFGVHHATGHSILRGRNPKRRCLGLDSESNETLWGCSDPDARTIENDPRYDKERLKTQYWHTLAAPEYDTSETRDVEIFGTRFWREELWGNAQRRFAWLDLAIPAELNMHFSPKSRINKRPCRKYSILTPVP